MGSVSAKKNAHDQDVTPTHLALGFQSPLFALSVLGHTHHTHHKTRERPDQRFSKPSMGYNSARAPPKKSAHDQDVTPTYLDLGFRTQWGLKLRTVTSAHASVL